MRGFVLPPGWAIPLGWAAISAVWIGISAAAPEMIWQGLKIALAHPRWADLVSALLIGLLLAFFIEPVIERVRDLLNRSPHPAAGDAGPSHALFAASLSFVFAVISVALHDAMIAIVAGGGGPGHAANNSGLTAAVLLAAEWAIVPFAVTLAWQSAGSGLLAVAMGAVGAASPLLAGLLFAWPLATIVTTEVPCLLILAFGYGAMKRAPVQQAFARCAPRLVLIAAIWLPVALLIDLAAGLAGQFYGWTDALVDARFYLGWAVGLLLMPLPVVYGMRGGRMAL